jgi:hypothetical protein
MMLPPQLCQSYISLILCWLTHNSAEYKKWISSPIIHQATPGISQSLFPYNVPTSAVPVMSFMNFVLSHRLQLFQSLVPTKQSVSKSNSSTQEKEKKK